MLRLAAVPSGKPADREDLVPEDRLVRTWVYILERTAGLEGAWPLAWIQPPTEGQNRRSMAIFAVCEPNPRFTGLLQMSVVKQYLEGWRQMERESEEQHPFKNDVTRDPLTWVMGQVVKGHGHVMASLREMSHPVEHIDWKTGERKTGESPTLKIN